MGTDGPTPGAQPPAGGQPVQQPDAVNQQGGAEHGQGVAGREGQQRGDPARAREERAARGEQSVGQREGAQAGHAAGL